MILYLYLLYDFCLLLEWYTYFGNHVFLSSQSIIMESTSISSTKCDNLSSTIILQYHRSFNNFSLKQSNRHSCDRLLSYCYLYCNSLFLLYTFFSALIIVKPAVCSSVVSRWSVQIVRIDRDWVLHTAKCTDEKTKQTSAKARGTIISWSSTETWHGRSLCS